MAVFQENCLWIRLCEFLTIFTYREIFFRFFQPLKNVKAVLSYWAIQKQAVVWTWPTGRSLHYAQNWGRKQK